MKKIGLWLSVLVLIFIFWREFSTKPPELVPPEFEQTKSSEPPAQETQQPRESKSEKFPASFLNQPVAPPPPADMGKVISAPPPAPPGGERPKPPPNSVPFELIEGLVIAYGDQLLGRPTMENFPKQGFIEAPKVRLWTGGEVPYSFAPGFRDPDRVKRVLDYFNQYTPVRFVPYSNQKDSIVFSPSEVPLCLSYLGKIGGHQPVYLDDRCFEKEITHELMHVLGFIHEQSRPDRDQFVKVVWNKIEEDKQSQYEIVPEAMARPHMGRPFDYQSVMIYDPTDFARVRGDVTLESLTGAKIEPTATGLSAEDLARLVNLYSK